MNSKVPICISKIVKEKTKFEVLCTEFHSNEVSGLLNIEEKQILVNKFDDFRRSRFTIAYLYFIFELQLHLIDKDEYCVLERSCYYHLDENINRKKAYKNAANLLVPEEILKRYIREDESVIAKIFEVPLWIFRLRH